MRLADPLWLLALVLLPLAALAQRWASRRKFTYAVRFSGAATLRAAVAAAPGGRWRRQLPVALLLAALAVLVVGLARPQISQRLPIRGASLVLVLDHSGSMASNDVSPTRLAAAEKAANTFIDQLPVSARVGVVAFSTVPDVSQQPVTDHTAAREAIDSQQAGGGTDTGPALQLALAMLDASKRDHPPAAIVLLSDGAANLGVDPLTVAAEAKRYDVPIYTVALGTPDGTISESGPFGEQEQVPVPPDPQLMDAIASTSDGRAFDAQTADRLSSIYQTLGERLSSTAHKRDVTVYAVLLAALLMLLALVSSVRTGARLP
jgi:Ca-activated chloride channel family protein